MNRRILDIGRGILSKERDGLTLTLERLDESFVRAVELLQTCTGRVAVSGMGKAGLIGAKIAATLSSTGTPAYVLHPADAIHGDLGMVCRDDVALTLSNSGESEELARIIPALKRIGCRVVIITGRPQSRCAALSDVVLDIGRQQEACPLGMAPSSSTTAMLALGDALALTVSEVKGFDAAQYASVHPGGALGRSLMRVEEIMRTGPDCPIISEGATVAEYLDAVLRAPSRAGAAMIVDEFGKLAGIFTHGDLGRLLARVERPGHCAIAEVMTRNPKCVTRGERVAAALAIMQQHRIDELGVVDAERRVVGLIDLQDLLAQGFSQFDDPG